MLAMFSFVGLGLNFGIEIQSETAQTKKTFFFDSLGQKIILKFRVFFPCKKEREREGKTKICIIVEI